MQVTRLPPGYRSGTTSALKGVHHLSDVWRKILQETVAFVEQERENLQEIVAFVENRKACLQVSRVTADPGKRGDTGLGCPRDRKERTQIFTR